MKDRLKEILGQGSNVGGWVKAFMIAGTIFVAVSSAYYKVGELEKYSGTHYRNIQVLQEDNIQSKMRLSTLERRADRSDAQIDKLADSLHTLNLSIVELNTTLKNKTIK